MDWNKNIPGILTGVGVVTNVAAVYSMYKAAPKIKEVIDNPRLTTGQKVLGVFKAGAIPITLSVISAGCSIGSYNIEQQRLENVSSQLAAATATAAIATRELQQWQQKTREVVGDEAVKDIKQQVVDEKAKNSKNTTILQPQQNNVTTLNHIETSLSGGNQLWYDERHDRWFRTSIVNIRDAVEKMNTNMRAYDFVSHGELYSEIGILAPLEDSDVGYFIGNNTSGIRLDEDATTVYPDTGELARVLRIDGYLNVEL